MIITEREIIPKIEQAIAVNNEEGQVTDIAVVLEPGKFTIRGTLVRPFRSTIQVSGSLLVRNGRIEAEDIKGKFGFISVPATYMAEATKEVNERLDPIFRSEFGIRVTHVEILSGELHLTGEDLR
jgi:hypothetical protein